MSIDIGKVSVPVNQNDGQISIDTKRIRADILSGQFDEISVTSNEHRVNPEVVQIPITLTSQEEIIGLVALKGAQGTSIASITKTGTSGLVDTYTILMTDGTTATFEVTNGEKGDTGNGIVSITKTGTSGLVDTYTILFTNGTTTTFTVTNGSGGSWGSITGTLSDQTDLQTALNAKANTSDLGDMAEEDDAPSNSKTYGRKNGNWSEVVSDVSWGDISGTLSDQTDLQNALDDKVDTVDLGDLASKDTVDWGTDIDNIPSSFPPSSHNHDDRYYTESEIDTKLNGKVSKSGDTMTGSLSVTGNLFQNNTQPDATKANNGLSGTVGYSYNRLDKNGLAIAYFDGYIRADGTISSAFGAINYDTSGSRIATLGAMITARKDGTGYWNVSAPDSFRNQISALNDIKVKSVNVTMAANATNASVTASPDSGYTFVCWIAATPYQFSGIFHYAPYSTVTSSIYQDYGSTTSSRTVTCYFLEKK